MISSATHTAADVIRIFGLEPLPHEGGWFRRIAAAEPAERIGQREPAPPPSGRRAWSAIYALFTPAGFSALHRLASDEVWCFHAGDPMESLRLHPDGRGEWVSLGLDPAAGQRAQDVVRSGVWQGTRLRSGGAWALVSCIVLPEFTWAEFEAAGSDELARRYPNWADDIRALTR